MIRRRALLGAGAAGLALVLTACAGDERPATGPRPLTVDEAELLSTVRFLNHQRTRSIVRATIPAAGRTLKLDGRVDWSAHSGYAQVHVPDRQENTLVRWDLGTASTRPAERAELPDPPPPSGWQQRPLDPRTDPVDAVLLLVLGLSADRPENAQLLRQGGASRLGEENIDGTPVTVFSGPRPPDSTGSAQDAAPSERRTRYWVDADGRLCRFAALVTGGKWATVDFPQGDAAPVPTVNPPEGSG
ncbi:hypothetical protein ACFP1Z_12690 [Streptomyces gamaensis]|uniref:Lipoprotein n=1 Tax=Streptomyces gamaensis TaxID=1763542 RepID=A0ABW0YWV2_9ACTN